MVVGRQRTRARQPLGWRSRTARRRRP